MRNRRRWPLFGILAVFIGVYWLLGSGAHLYTEWLWFLSLGFQDIFLKILLTEIGMRLFAAVVFFSFLFVNLLFTRKYVLKAIKFTPEGADTVEISPWHQLISPRLVTLIFFLGSAVAALAFSSLMSNKWLVLHQYLNPVNMGVSDPLFGKELSFYIFSLPWHLLLYRLSFGMVLFTTVAIILIYSVTDPLKGYGFWRSRHALRHLSFLAVLIFALKAWGYYLNQFLLFYSERGVVFGPGYTDIHASLLAIRVLFFVALAVALLSVLGVVRSSLRYPLFGLGTLVVASFVLGVLYPAVVQKFVVEPNELNRERPYIENAIAFTRKAYGLDAIERKSFPAGKTLNLDDIKKNRDSFENIRLWDWKPLKETYTQLQEIRLYYQFHDIDIDRYRVNGEYRQVMLAARELNQDRLSPQAKTWINQHLKYTHGYGVAMSPVNEVTTEGLPEFFIKDIPPQSRTDLKVTRPEIYFGELESPYVIVNTKTGEFDYPKGDENVYTSYKGKGGVQLGGFWQRLLFALSFNDYRFLLSTDITSDSKVLYHRDIRQRVQQIAPFLSYDDDPYVVLADGRLYYMWDAYTTTRWFPYSEPYDGFNYIRNPVKVVIDAYNGDVRFYLIDTQDPLAQSLARIFPDLFTPFKEMPRELAEHIRYPEQMFLIQAQMYTVFHMQDPQVFYNKEDKWVLPKEVFGGEEIRVEPYYIITRLPGDKEPEFMLIIPFTPQNKNNMIAWFAARCDGENYGRLLVYEFPKQELVYGPMQVEARINQDTQISQQLTLWDQRGSNVIRGNLLIIPIKDALLYVEPLYLQAEQSKMPELRRVIVVHGDQIVMEPTLESALEKVFGGRTESEPAPEEPEEKRSVSELIQKANEYFNNADKSLRNGDWSGYGKSLEQLKEVLRELEEQTR
ncbi:MAG: UPF0182 family protein [Bacillota bacterium]